MIDYIKSSIEHIKHRLEIIMGQFNYLFIHIFIKN